MSLNKACVILGARASYDVAGEGSPIANTDFRPPLAQDLFDIKKHVAYWDVMVYYNGAQVLSQELAPLISSGNIGIEKALRKYAEHSDSRIQEHFKHVPAYLRDLLFRASTEYTYVPSSYIQLVIKLLADYPHDVTFITLNYDNLLESALRRFDAKFQFENIGAYVDDERNAKVVKLHGSIDWFKRLPGGRTEGWDSGVARLNVFEQIPEHEIKVKAGIHIVRDAVAEDDRLYPIITAPLAGKGLIDIVCPKSHVTAGQEFMKDCSKFLIIGTSGLDEDLLTFVDNAVPPKSRPLVHIVDRDGGADNTRTKFEEGVRAFRNTRQTPSQSTFKEGFRNYLSSQPFQAFLESD